MSARVGDRVQVLVGGYAGDDAVVRDTHNGRLTLYTHACRTLYGYREDQVRIASVSCPGQTGRTATGSTLSPPLVV